MALALTGSHPKLYGSRSSDLNETISQSHSGQFVEKAGKKIERVCEYN